MRSLRRRRGVIRSYEMVRLSNNRSVDVPRCASRVTKPLACQVAPRALGHSEVTEKTTKEAAIRLPLPSARQGRRGRANIAFVARSLLLQLATRHRLVRLADSPAGR